MTRAVFMPLTLLVPLLGAPALVGQQSQPPARPGLANVHRQNPAARNPSPSRPVTASPSAPSGSRVVFRDGLLSVHAHNTNLADVLNAIQRKTGASFEFPSSAAQEPVAVDLGPASPHDVLASLLNGSRFDYIVLGRSDNPSEIATVMLQEKSGANGLPNSAAEPPPAAGNYQPPAEVQENADDVPTEIPDDAQQQQPEPGAAPDQQKTPEQMLEELKRMQQQQQTQQQRQGQQPNQPGAPPQFPQTQQQVPLQGPFPQQPYPQQQPPQPQQQQSPPQDDSEPQPH